MNPSSSNFQRPRGFTLVELLVSITILTIILTMTASIVGATGKTWEKSKARVGQFRDARLAFELLTRNLSQSTLNTYWDYELIDNPNGPPDPSSPAYPKIPSSYKRQSELQFVVADSASHFTDTLGGHPGHATFFQALLGEDNTDETREMESLLNPRGYYIEFAADSNTRPAFYNALFPPSSVKYRYRLMEYAPPSSSNEIYRSTPKGEAANPFWFSEPSLLLGNSRPISDNIIALILSPRRSLEDPSDPNSTYSYSIAPDYTYDSTLESNANNIDTLHTLPPMINVTLVAIDERSAARLQLKYGTSPPNLMDSTWFKKVSDYNDDLKSLEERLLDENLDYRVFTTTIAIRSAKWSPAR